MSSSWIDHAVWWHVYPLGFTGGLHAPPGHRLPQLEGWLDYAIELGANGLQLGPIFASETHGYDTLDYFRIDPRLGDDGDFDALVKAAHDKGLRIMLDGVFNHVGRGFAAPEHWFSGRDFEGHGALRQLDHDQPEVLDLVVRVMNHWLDRGVDAWRLDAAYAVKPEFWRAALERVRPKHPDAWFTGEVIHGDYAGYLRDSGLDSITQYELWKAIWSSLNDGNFYELAHALDRHADLVAKTPLIFVGNHDVTRITSKLVNPSDLGLALAVLFTVGGVPSVYYGDEQAFQGVKEDREGGDDAVRPAFPSSRDELAPYGWETFHLHQELIGIRRRNPWLTHAVTSATHLTNTAVALTSTHGDHRLVTRLNVGDEPYTFPDDIAVEPHGWSIT